MSEKLSEENRALIERLESHLGISPQTADYLIEHWGQANILLNAARAEARPAPVVDREAVARIVDREAVDAWENLPDFANMATERNRQIDAAYWRAIAKADAILALLSPATSPDSDYEAPKGASAPHTAFTAEVSINHGKPPRKVGD